MLLLYRRYTILLMILIGCCTAAIENNIVQQASIVDEYKIIETTNGLIKGKLYSSLFQQKSYYAFKGIPYAEPPINDLRFKAPKPHNTWTNVRDAIDFGDVCLQFNNFAQKIIGSENCLYLNIYAPVDAVLSENGKFPVMFYIHGGGFAEGSGNDDLYGPDFLINENVILVTINYRLGPIGFMSLGTSEYSGNMGLKDQQLALKWINDNIEIFGGDSKKITIFGHSAGAVSTHFHVIAPSSRGLYQQAIIMSGGALHTWSYYEFREHLLYLFNFALENNNPVTNYKDLLNYLLPISGTTLIKKLITKPNVEHVLGRVDMEFLWMPIIEGNHAINPFITSTPEDIIKNDINHVDMMIGFVSDEFLLFMANVVNNPDQLVPFNNTFEFAMPDKEIRYDFDSEEYKKIAKKARKFYFGKSDVSNETLHEYIDLLSDSAMIYGVDKAAKLHAEKSSKNVYYYRFSADTTLNFHKKFINLSSWPGAIHADELCYLFRCNIDMKMYENISMDSNEMVTLQHITKLWANFAKFGNPTPNGVPVNFQPIQQKMINFLDIRSDGLYPAESPNRKSIEFWQDIISKYGKTAILEKQSRDNQKIEL